MINEHITRVSLFDNDNSLMDSPLNTKENKALWEKVKGREWNKNPKTGEYYEGWWGKLESLDNDVFDIKLIEDVKQDALNRIECNNTFTAILTGRRAKFTTVVKEIIRKNGVPYMDDYFFNDEGKTELFKMNKMSMLLEQFPNLKTMELWEDRTEHFEQFRQWGKDNMGDGFILHVVKDNKIIR